MHIYESNGKKLPSVTTIVHAIGNEAITKWSNWLGFKHIKYEDELNRSANFGTLVHSHLQSIVDPSAENLEVLEPANSVEKMDLDISLTYFRNLIRLYDFQTVFTEKTVVSEELGYAGTLDWLAYMNGYLMLNDFKTSKQPRFGMMLQLGGYYNLLKTIGYDPDGASIITVNTNGAKLHPINKRDLLIYSEWFNDLAVFYNKTELYKDPQPIYDFEFGDKLKK